MARFTAKSRPQEELSSSAHNAFSWCANDRFIPQSSLCPEILDTILLGDADQSRMIWTV